MLSGQAESPQEKLWCTGMKERGGHRGTQNGTRARRSKSTRPPPPPTPREEACHKGNLVPSLPSWFPGTRLPPSERTQRGSPTPKTGPGVPQPRHPRGPLLPPASLILSHASPSDFIPKEVTEMSKRTRKKEIQYIVKSYTT